MKIYKSSSAVAINAQPSAEALTPRSASWRMSSSLQQVILSPSFTGCGYFPVRTPSHQVDFETGRRWRTSLRRMRRPVAGGLSRFLSKSYSYFLMA